MLTTWPPCNEDNFEPLFEKIERKFGKQSNLVKPPLPANAASFGVIVFDLLKVSKIVCWRFNVSSCLTFQIIVFDLLKSLCLTFSNCVSPFQCFIPLDFFIVFDHLNIGKVLLKSLKSLIPTWSILVASRHHPLRSGMRIFQRRFLSVGKVGSWTRSAGEAGCWTRRGEMGRGRREKTDETKISLEMCPHNVYILQHLFFWLVSPQGEARQGWAYVGGSWEV